MQTMKAMPASAASMIASAAPRGGTEMNDGRAGLLHRLGHRGEDRDALDLLPASLGVRAAHDLGAVRLVAQAVVEPLARRADALNHDLGRLVDEDAHVGSFPLGPVSGRYALAEASATARRAASSMVGSAISVSDRCRPASADRVGVGAVEAHHDGRAELDPAHRLDDALGHLVDPGDAAEDVDEDGLDCRVGVDHLERVGHHVGVGTAADVQEVGRAPADLGHDVERRHGEPGAVGDDADVCRRARCS